MILVELGNQRSPAGDIVDNNAYGQRKVLWNIDGKPRTPCMELLGPDAAVLDAVKLGFNDRQDAKETVHFIGFHGYQNRFFCRSEAGRRCSAIRSNKPAAAKQHAAEPARDDNDNTIDRLPVDCLEDRFASCTTGLAIVVKAISLTHTPSPAIMTGLRLDMQRERSFGLALVANGRRQSSKSAFLDFLYKGGCFVDYEHKDFRLSSKYDIHHVGWSVASGDVELVGGMPSHAKPIRNTKSKYHENDNDSASQVAEANVILASISVAGVNGCGMLWLLAIHPDSASRQHRRVPFHSPRKFDRLRHLARHRYHPAFR